jgi:hypothetical protein
MRELIEKLATWPHGLGFLHLAEVEAIATTLHVHPFVVVEARKILETPEGRAQLIEEVHHVREMKKPVLTPKPVRKCGPSAPTLHTPEELIEAARNHPYGIVFLTHGHPEAVAVTFCVHPDLVFEARELLDKQSPAGNRESKE